MGDYIAVVPMRPLRFLSPHTSGAPALIKCILYRARLVVHTTSKKSPLLELFSSKSGPFRFLRAFRLSAPFCQERRLR